MTPSRSALRNTGFETAIRQREGISFRRNPCAMRSPSDRFSNRSDAEGDSMMYTKNSSLRFIVEDSSLPVQLWFMQFLSKSLWAVLPSVYYPLAFMPELPWFHGRVSNHLCLAGVTLFRLIAAQSREIGIGLPSKCCPGVPRTGIARVFSAQVGLWHARQQPTHVI